MDTVRMVTVSASRVALGGSDASPATGARPSWSLLPLLLCAVLLVGGCTGPVARSDEPPLTIALVGQALIKDDLRSFAPVAVEQAKAYLAGADVVFTNLEVAVAPPGAAVTPRTDETVIVSPDVLDNLREMGFNLLALSNNHALDLGVEGLFATIDEVERRGFAHAGTGADLTAAGGAGYLDTPHGRVALIGIASGAVQLVPDTWAGPGKPGVNFLELRPDGTLNPEQREGILAAVGEAAEQSDLVIVYHHNHYWGEARGLETPPNRERRIDRFDTPVWMEELARDLVDAGAGMFVAHGNPALHGIEIYRGRPILYGLGNYIFQAAGEPDRYGPMAYQSAVVHVELTAGEVTGLRVLPLVLALEQSPGKRRGTPYLAQGGEAYGILLWLKDRSARYGTTLRIEGDSAVLELP